MVKKVLVTSLIIISIFLLSFFIWHFFFSIYEVKLEVRNTTGKENVIKTNSQIGIELIGINSFGWALPWRKIESNLTILDGNNLCKISKHKNVYTIVTFNNEGKLRINIKPLYSLNPSELAFQIKK